jgi:DNA polymerase-3 subunit delta'
VAERVAAGGLYAPPSGSEAIFVATARALVHAAAMAPALARRKVFVVGDAERMVPQEGAEYAANAFLKLLEEPPADTTIILTSSEPGSLLPTIRSRVVGFRVPPVAAADVRAFAAHPVVSKALDDAGLPGDAAARARLAGGAPGALLAEAARGESFAQARRLLEAATSADRAVSARVAFAQGAAKARGGFSDALEALTVVLHERARGAADRGDERAALGGARAVGAVERAKEMASGNVNPQLVTASLLRALRAELA